jgi:bifunctional non-homologous end joining protein LigD
MIHRMDPPEDPDRRAPPRNWRPMVAREGEGAVPAEGWAFEPRWTGLRVLVINTPGMTTLIDSEGRDVSTLFPEVRRLSRALGSTEVVLDGVVTGEPSSLARRLEHPSDSVIRRLARDHPVCLRAFDLLWRDGYPRIDAPWHERREELEGLGLAGPAWQVPDLLPTPATPGKAPDAVAKRREARYRPGTVTEDWVVVRASRGG